jgi:hypothetical protein
VTGPHPGGGPVEVRTTSRVGSTVAGSGRPAASRVSSAEAASSPLRRCGWATVVSPSAVAGLGLAAVAAGDAVLVAGTPVLVAAGLAAAGAGIGLPSVASTAAGTDVPEELQGTASGALTTAAQLGSAPGVAAVLLVARASEGSGLPLAGPPLGWAAAAVTAAAAAAVLLRRG